jgi:hypothetical protein
MQQYRTTRTETETEKHSLIEVKQCDQADNDQDDAAFID